MTTQQPPTDNWPQAQAGSQYPQPGSQYPQPGTPFPPAGYPPAGKPRSRRRKVIVAVIVIVVAIAGIVAGYTLSAKPKGSVSLPGTLLTLPKASTPSARHIAATLRAKEKAGYGSKVSDVVAGVYGRNTGPWFAISGGGICGTCAPKSASVIRNHLAAIGYTDAAIFPAGPKGGDLACGSATSSAGRLIRCTWVDDMTAGDVLYANGAASGLADAAAKTNQARAAVEG